MPIPYFTIHDRDTLPEPPKTPGSHPVSNVPIQATRRPTSSPSARPDPNGPIDLQDNHAALLSVMNSAYTIASRRLLALERLADQGPAALSPHDQMLVDHFTDHIIQLRRILVEEAEVLAAHGMDPDWVDVIALQMSERRQHRPYRPYDGTRGNAVSALASVQDLPDPLTDAHGHAGSDGAVQPPSDPGFLRPVETLVRDTGVRLRHYGQWR